MFTGHRPQDCLHSLLAFELLWCFCQSGPSASWAPGVGLGPYWALWGLQELVATALPSAKTEHLDEHNGAYHRGGSAKGNAWKADSPGASEQPRCAEGLWGSSACALGPLVLPGCLPAR